MKTRWHVAEVHEGVKALRPDPEGVELAGAAAALADHCGRVLVMLSGMAPEDLAAAADSEESLARSDAESALAALPGLTVGCINGIASGCAAQLALSCRLRVAGADGALVFPEVSEGLLPAGQTLWRLYELAGMAETLALIVRGRRIEAHQAAAMHLVDAICASEAMVGIALEIAPRPRPAPARLFRSRLGRWLIRRQALGELAARAAPAAATAAVRLLFDLARAPAPRRAAAVAAQVRALAADPEHAQLVRLERARERFLTGEKRLPARALVVMGEGGWQWTCLLAHLGVRVRWCWPESKILADGMCWILRDTERYLPDRVAAVMNAITVCLKSTGFAARDFIVVDAPDRLEAGRPDADAVVLVDGPRAEGFAGVALPRDALTSRVCVLANGNPRAEHVLRALGFLVLPRAEGRVVLDAVAGFDAKWIALREAGLSERALMASLQRFGFSTRELGRRLRMKGRLGAAAPDPAYDMVCAMWKRLRESPSPAADARDLLDLALVLETGFPAHRGGPLGFFDAIKERPFLLEKMGLGSSGSFAAAP